MINRPRPLAGEVLGQGSPVVLIHGAGGNARSNYPFLDDLARSYTVFAPDLPGAGASDVGSEPLTPAVIGARLLAALDDLGIGRAALCGYSMGTMVAAWLAAHAPQRVSALILTAGLARADFACQGTMARWCKLLERDQQRAGRFVVDHVYLASTLAARGSTWASAMSGEVGRSFAPGTSAHIQMVRSADVRPEVAATSQPLLLIVPSGDAFVHPRHSEEIRSLRPDAQVVHLECGHAVGDEQPAAWLAAIRDFLDHVGVPGDDSEQRQQVALDAR